MTKTVILAGGKGTRLRPYTVLFPKPLVPLGDRPILEVVLRQLASEGFLDVTLCVGHLSNLIMAYFGDGSGLDTGTHITYQHEDHPLGTAGPIAPCEGLTDPTLVLNGDVLTDMSFAAFVEQHQTSGAALSVAAARRDIPIDLGVLDFTPDGALQAYTEKPTLHYWSSMGIYAYSARALGSLVPGQRLDVPDLVQRLMSAGEAVHVVPWEGYYQDIGRPEDYEAATEAAARGHLSLAPTPGPAYSDKREDVEWRT